MGYCAKGRYNASQMLHTISKLKHFGHNNCLSPSAALLALISPLMSIRVRLCANVPVPFLRPVIINEILAANFVMFDAHKKELKGERDYFALKEG
jgi:hypothetical protein